MSGLSGFEMKHCEMRASYAKQLFDQASSLRIRPAAREELKEEILEVQKGFESLRQEWGDANASETYEKLNAKIVNFEREISYHKAHPDIAG